MKKQILSLVAALTALSLNSCLQHETTINLNKDGSGTIVEETRMSAQALAMMNFGEEENEEQAEASDPLKKLMSEENAAKRAKELGEGVTFVKAEPVTIGMQKGARITYRFADINKVRLKGTQGLDVMNSEMEAEEEDVNDSGHISFNYKGGVLTVKPNIALNDNEGLQGENSGEKEMTDKEFGMMKMMLADMKVSMKLVFDSGIAETNATHQDKNTITILEMDMNKVMEKPENFKKLNGLEKAKPAEALTALNKIDGVKAENKPEITIKLK